MSQNSRTIADIAQEQEALQRTLEDLSQTRFQTDVLKEQSEDVLNQIQQHYSQLENLSLPLSERRDLDESNISTSNTLCSLLNDIDSYQLELKKRDRKLTEHLDILSDELHLLYQQAKGR